MANMAKKSANDIDEMRAQLAKESKDYWGKFFGTVGTSLIIGLVIFLLVDNPYFLFVVPLSLFLFCARLGLPKSYPVNVDLPQTKEPQKTYSASLEQIQCPHCGTTTDIGEVYCSKCRRSIR